MTLRFLVCLMVLVGVGCDTRSMNVSELVGTYSVKYPHGAETLVLSADNTFTQVYAQLGNGGAITNSGNWAFKKDDGEILLKGVFVFDDSGHKRQPLEKSSWRIRIAKRLGKISLIIGEAGVLEYAKTR